MDPANDAMLILPVSQERGAYLEISLISGMYDETCFRLLGRGDPNLETPDQ
jgi:hypothetical protein